MHELVDMVYDNTRRDLFTDAELQRWLPGSSDARYGRVKRAIAKGDIVHLKRGLYALGPRYRRRPIDLFELAQYIYGPSCISLESALSYHGLIPEAVRTVSSVSPLRRAEFVTPAGRFAYETVPGFSFYTQVERRQTSDAVFFVASPLRALFDYVYTRKIDTAEAAPLLKSLRIDLAELEPIGPEEIDELQQYFLSRRMDTFATALRTELFG